MNAFYISFINLETGKMLLSGIDRYYIYPPMLVVRGSKRITGEDIANGTKRALSIAIAFSLIFLTIYLKGG